MALSLRHLSPVVGHLLSLGSVAALTQPVGVQKLRDDDQSFANRGSKRTPSTGSYLKVGLGKPTLLSTHSHDRLAEVLSVEHADEGFGRLLQTIDDVFAISNPAFPDA